LGKVRYIQLPHDATFDLFIYACSNENVIIYIYKYLIVVYVCNYHFLSIEAQSQKFYTPEVFERFQKMISTSTRFHPIHVEAEKLS
jgi:hypothetical protein